MKIIDKIFIKNIDEIGRECINKREIYKKYFFEVKTLTLILVKINFN